MLAWKKPSMKGVFGYMSFSPILQSFLSLQLNSPPAITCKRSWKIKALHIRITGIQTTGNKLSDLLKTQIFWLCASVGLAGLGWILCTYTAGLIPSACRCISARELLIRNREASTPCLQICSLPRQIPSSRAARQTMEGLHYIMASKLVTQNKVQRAAYRRVDITLSALQMGKLRQGMMTWTACSLCPTWTSIS